MYYFTNQLLHGMARAADKELKLSVKTNFRGIENIVQLVAIDDHELYAEIRRFNRNCYQPAMAKYQRFYETAHTPFMKKILEDKPTDLDWMGSEILLRTKGLYAECVGDNCVFGDGYKAKSSVKHVTFDKDYGDYRTPQGLEIKMPHCSDWWQGRIDDNKDVGIRGRLLKFSKGLVVKENGISEMTFFDRAKLAIASIAKVIGKERTQYEYEDAVIRNILTNTARSEKVNPNLGKDNNTAANMLGFMASFKAFVQTEVTVQTLKNNLHLILAFLQFVLIFSLPFIGLFGLFYFNALLAPLVYFVTLKISPFIWSVVDYVDNKLLEKMGLNSMWENLLVGNNDDLVSAQQTFVAEIIVMGLYLILPIVLSRFLNTVVGGSSVYGAISEQTGAGASKVSEGASKQGQNIASKISYKGKK